MSSNKFLHEQIYRGDDYVEKLKKHTITVCGVGSLGSNLVDSLSRQGFPNIRVIDKDRVDAHNVGSQVYGDKDVGALKVAALKNRVFSTVGIEIETFDKELTASNAKKFLKDSTLVIDAFDNGDSRQLVQDECRARKIPLIHCGISGEDSFGEVVYDENYKVRRAGLGDICDYPLARNLALFVCCIAAEEILDFCLEEKPRKSSWSITLKDLAIRKMI